MNDLLELAKRLIRWVSYNRVGGVEVSVPMRQPDRGALHIPAADGYHFADDHPWNAEDQQNLIDVLRATAEESRQHPPDNTHCPGATA
jgi:hypothetical protein